MRRRFNLVAASLAIGAGVCGASASRADDAATPESQLQQGARLAERCLEPKPDWPAAKLSSNFDACNDAVQVLVQAIELGKRDAKIVEAASSAFTRVNVNTAATALPMARNYVQHNEPKPALAFLRVVCTSSDGASSFDKLTSEQSAAMKAAVEEADRLLQAYHTSCKAIVAPG